LPSFQTDKNVFGQPEIYRDIMRFASEFDALELATVKLGQIAFQEGFRRLVAA